MGLISAVGGGVVEAELASVCLLCGQKAMVLWSVGQCRPGDHAKLPSS